MNSIRGQGTAGPTERQIREYDAFGPWALKVGTAEELPGCFDPWAQELLACALVVKFPKAAERRDLKVGELLYESLLALDQDSIHYLEVSQGGEILRRDIVLGDIVALRLERELLKGRLSLDLRDGTTAPVDFNTVSAPLMEEFLGLVLGKLSPQKQDPFFLVPGFVPEPGEGDSLFKALLGDLRKSRADMELLAYQGPYRLKPQGNRKIPGIRRLLAGLPVWRLDSALIAQTDQGVLVLREGSKPRTRTRKGYYYERLFLPRRHLIGAEALGIVLAQGSPVCQLRLDVEGHSYFLVFLEDPRLVPCHSKAGPEPAQ